MLLYAFVRGYRLIVIVVAHVLFFPTWNSSLRVAHNLRVHVLRNFPSKAHSNANNLLRIQAWQISQNLIRTIPLSAYTLKPGSSLSSFEGVCLTYLALSKISPRINTSCATIHSTFKCGPYANKKSHSFSTSVSGGVHAHMVSILANP